jgi:hypothetical protein
LGFEASHETSFGGETDRTWVLLEFGTERTAAAFPLVGIAQGAFAILLTAFEKISGAKSPADKSS